MIRTAIRSVIICSMALTVIGIAVPAGAQAPEPKAAATSDTARAAPSTAADTPAPASQTHAATAKTAAAADVPSADVLKKARNAGYHTRVKQGEVYYCKTQTDTGSRFSKEVCLNEAQLEQTLLVQQGQRDALAYHAATYSSGK